VKMQLARIREVMSGHSARVLVHAVDADGLEYKLEVPADAARGLAEGHVLWIAWSAHPMPPMQPEQAAAPPTQSASAAAGRSPDEQFMALMDRQRATPTVAGETSPAPRQSLEETFGLLLRGEARRS
jgi:hypothetical protein